MKNLLENIEIELKQGVKDISLKTLKKYCLDLELNLNGNKQQLYNKLKRKIEKKNINLTLDVSDTINTIQLRYIKTIIGYIEDIGDPYYHHNGLAYINPTNKEEYILDLDTSIYNRPHQIIIIMTNGNFEPIRIYPKNQDIKYKDTELLKVLNNGYIGIEKCEWSATISPGVMYIYWSNFLYENNLH